MGNMTVAGTKGAFGTALEERIFLVITIILLCMALYLTIAGVVIISHCCGLFRKKETKDVKKAANEVAVEEDAWVIPFRNNSRERAFSSVARIGRDETEEPVTV